MLPGWKTPTTNQPNIRCEYSTLHCKQTVETVSTLHTHISFPPFTEERKQCTELHTPIGMTWVFVIEMLCSVCTWYTPNKSWSLKVGFHACCMWYVNAYNVCDDFSLFIMVATHSDHIFSNCYVERSSVPSNQITFAVRHMKSKLLYSHVFHFMSHSHATYHIGHLSF